MRLELLHIKQCVSKHRKEVHNGANPLHSPSLKMTKAVTTALGRNPKVKTKGESMCNGFKSLLPTATIEL